MLVLRPITLNDLDALMKLLEKSGHGLTTLPYDRTILKDKILLAEAAFSHNGTRPNGEYYLFAMEDMQTKTLAGVSGIIAQIGAFEPYYFNIITGENNHIIAQETVFQNGPAEICSIFLNENYRKGHNGKLLSLSRFMFMSRFRHYFPKTVIAEMRGRVHDDGTNPFWDAVGFKITGIPFTEADRKIAMSQDFVKRHLLGKNIFIKDLPHAAQIIIGKVHDHTEPAKRILEKQGFSFKNRLGILEPGPVLEANIDDIKTVKETKQYIIFDIQDNVHTKQYIVSSGNNAMDFKNTLGHVKWHDNESIVIESLVAKALNLRVGDSVYILDFSL